MVTAKSKSVIIPGLVVGIVFVALLAIGISSIVPTASGKYDEFAQCVSDAGAKMYGAYWCPHCNSQKARFGESWKYIKYIECSEPNRAGTKKVCTDAGIQGYPEWHFQDNSKEGGDLPLTRLAAKTGCKLPE